MLKMLTGVLEKNANIITSSGGLRNKGTMNIEKLSSYCRWND
jgi:hypothetical protein